ncbi:MAG: AAA family ATPase [Spirochaetales bacterium]|nr:AAA family ATPase [Spirochaetales bacterium]
MNGNARQPLAPEALRRRIEPETLGITDTEALEPLTGIIGQKRALRALRFGLEMKGSGYSIYVSGPPGIGKMTSVRAFLEEVAASRPGPPDWCYVYNLGDPYEPRAIRLEGGQGREFKKDMEDLIEEVRKELSRSFESDEYASRRDRKQAEIQKSREAVFEKIREKAESQGFQIGMTPVGMMLVPVRDGEALKDEQFHALPEEEQARIKERRQELSEEIREALKQIRGLQRRENEELRRLDEQVVMNMLGGLFDDLAEKYQGHEPIAAYFEEVKKDILENVDALKISPGGQAQNMEMLQGKRQLEVLQEQQFRRYQVNVVVDNGRQEGAPVVVELNPTYMNLIGRIEKEMQMGAVTTDFTLIKPGALLRALGGFLVLPVEDLLLRPLSWDALKRALRGGEIRIEEPGEQYGLMTIKTLRPQPIPLDVKVVLVGRPLLYHLLHRLDADFPELFKVKADFDVRMERSAENDRDFLRFVHTFCSREKLRHPDAGGAARLMEHAARTAEAGDRLSTNFGTLADLIREADHWASRDGGDGAHIDADHVRRALEERVFRSDLLQERIKELIREGTLLIDLEGEKVGQANGLSIIDLGDYRFGRPNRITASVSPGRSGIVDIERESHLGGPIHSKGVLILGGFLAQRYAAGTPLALAARLVFEQSYEGVEGDSASLAEVCALLSALAGVPLRQGIAVTGAMSQHGMVQPVGGINEKVEGFYDVCRAAAADGQGSSSRRAICAT